MPEERDAQKEKTQRTKQREKRSERVKCGACACESAGEVLPAHADVVVVGGGPHAVALVTRLLTRGEVLQDANGPVEGYRNAPKDVRQHLFNTPVVEPLKQSILVIDRSGGWMLNWQRAYRALGITHLRSPESLHPDPYDHSALNVFAKGDDEFVEMAGLERFVGRKARGRGRSGGTDRYRGPFRLPSVDVFAKFCSHLIDTAYGLSPLLREGEVTGIAPLPEGAGFELTVARAGGVLTKMTASNVVLARGPTARRRLPEWAEPLIVAPEPGHCGNPLCGDPCPSPPMSIAHAWDIIGSNATTGLAPKQQAASSAFARAVLPTDRVVVVGGGLTSAHLVVLLAEVRRCRLNTSA